MRWTFILVCLRLSGSLGFGTFRTKTITAPGKPVWLVILCTVTPFLRVKKSSQSVGNHFLLSLNPVLTHWMRTNKKLENFRGHPGVSRKIERILVERCLPPPPPSCSPLAWFRTPGRPAPHACEVFLCSSSPSPLAAAAVTARIKEDVQYVLSPTLAVASRGSA